MYLHGEARAHQRKTWYGRLSRLVLSLELSRSGGDSFWDCRVLSKPFGCNPRAVYAFSLNKVSGGITQLMDRHSPHRRALAIQTTASPRQVSIHFCIYPRMSTSNTIFQMGRSKRSGTHFVGLSFHDKLKLEVFRIRSGRGKPIPVFSARVNSDRQAGRGSREETDTSGIDRISIE